jgi:agmatinase
VTDVASYLPTTTNEERLPFETWDDTRVAPRSFYGAPLCPDLDDLDAQVALLGVPFDLGIGIPGQRFAPNSIRDTGGFPRGVYSCSGPDGSPVWDGYYDIDTDQDRLRDVSMADCGDVLILPSEVERNFWRITRTVRRIVSRGSLLVAVGGDNSITAPVVRGFDSYQTLDIVQFDAHHDFLDHAQGVRWSAGSALRRVSEFEWVRNITQIGLRTARSRGPIDDARARGNRIITTDQFQAMGGEEAIALVPESDALYVDIDIDVLDPAVCPGVSASEPGGLSYAELRTALCALARRCRIVGIDLVEVAPSLDPTGRTSKTASRLLIDLLAAIADEQ